MAESETTPSNPKSVAFRRALGYPIKEASPGSNHYDIPETGSCATQSSHRSSPFHRDPKVSIRRQPRLLPIFRSLALLIAPVMFPVSRFIAGLTMGSPVLWQWRVRLTVGSLYAMHAYHSTCIFFALCSALSKACSSSCESP